MRLNQSEKIEIIRMVEESNLSIRRTLAELDIPRSTFYKWYGRYVDNGYDGLADFRPNPKRIWNRIPASERDQVRKIAWERPELTPRELAYHRQPEILHLRVKRLSHLKACPREGGDRSI